MPLYLTGAHSSRVTKPRIKRTASLPFATTKAARTLQRSHTVANILKTSDNDLVQTDFKLDDTSSPMTTVRNDSKDVLSAITQSRLAMFDEIPEERAGMNSVRIAEVLNYQRNLPAVVSLAHIHALRSASTRTERDIQSLLSCNSIRRLKLVGRGNGVSGLAELLIPTHEYEKALRDTGLPIDVLQAFSVALKAHPRVHALPPHSLSRTYADALTRAGFLVSPSIQASRTYSRSCSSTSIIAPSVVSRSASGSQAAVGGDAAFETMGGINGIRRTESQSTGNTEYVLSVPGLAAYLKLLEAGRIHLLDLLRQFSRYSQAPLYLLRERWNGNIDDNSSSVSMARRIRGQFSNVLPARTKKWKALNGLSFDWVVEECLGAGLIELFETHSVGLGVKALT